MRPSERCIGGGVIRVEVNRTLKVRGRLIVLVTACMRQELATAQHVFIRGKIFGGLRKDALCLEAGELDGRRADHSPGDVVLDVEDVFDFGVVGFGPDMNPGPGLGQLDVNAEAIAGTAYAAL